MLKKAAALLLAFSMLFGNVVWAEANTGVMSYTDVSENDWYYEYVKYVHDRGLMTGLNETTFGAGETLARAQFALILYRMNGEPQVAYSPRFTDVPKDEWYTDAIMWASDAGIVTGYSNGYFGPGDTINREQMATMMYRYAGYKQYDISGKGVLTLFPDKDYVNDFSKQALQWTVGLGIISGDQGRINPQGAVYRAVCATIIQRFIDRCEENVTDNTEALNVYRSLLLEYKDGLEHGFYGGDFSKIPNVNPELYLSGSDDPDLCYAFVDLSGDGKKEMLIADCSERMYNWYNVPYNVYDFYGYQDGNVSRCFPIASMGYRMRYSLCEGGIVKVRGSGGAYTYGYEFYKFNPGSVAPERICSLDYDGWNGDYYTMTDAQGNSSIITEAQWNAYVNQYADKTDIMWYSLEDFQ